MYGKWTALLAIGCLLTLAGCQQQTKDAAVASDAVAAAPVTGESKPPQQPVEAAKSTSTEKGATAKSTSPQTTSPSSTEVAVAPVDKKEETKPAPAKQEKAAEETPPKKVDPQQEAKNKELDLPENPFTRKIPAPELVGGVGWINTAGPLELRQLRGKFVLLDFWTYCCINCMHILPELKKLEKKYPNQLVVIGVHSAKFDGEQDSQNITDAVLRYEIEHPVVNDAKHAIWNNYGISSWPSMLWIDPEGNAVHIHQGEVTFETLDEIMQAALPYYRAKKVLDETPLRFDLAAFKAEPTPLRYPGKVAAYEKSKRLFIADSNHNRLVVTSFDGTLLDVIGSGKIGAADGDFATCSFNKPQGMFLQGDTLYVADTENHLLRKIDLKAKKVATIAGVGTQGRNAWPGLDKVNMRNFDAVKLPERWVGKPLETAINSPWDLWIHGKDLYIAMAGPHQIWKMPLDESEIGPFAGNGREDIVDGPLLPKEPYGAGFSSFAQPSGLTSDGEWLYVADSEGSSIRAVPFDPAKNVTTIIGTSHLQYGRLFDFGDIDGDSMTAKFQHLLGVAWHKDKLYVADTYNNKIKVVDVRKMESRLLAGNGKPGKKDEPAEFDEPAGIAAADGKLFVADTNNHLIRVVDLSNNKVSTLTIKGLEPPKIIEDETPAVAIGAKEIAVKSSNVKPVDGQITLDVALALAPGWKINDLAPMRYTVTAEGAGPVNRAAIGKSVKLDEPAAKFTVKLPVGAITGDDTVKLSLNYYYCREGAEGLCKAGTVVWTVPVKLAADGGESVPLTLAVE